MLNQRQETSAEAKRYVNITTAVVLAVIVLLPVAFYSLMSILIPNSETWMDVGEIGGKPVAQRGSELVVLDSFNETVKLNGSSVFIRECRGILGCQWIYEHNPGSLPVQQVVQENNNALALVVIPTGEYRTIRTVGVITEREMPHDSWPFRVQPYLTVEWNPQGKVWELVRRV